MGWLYGEMVVLIRSSLESEFVRTICTFVIYEAAMIGEWIKEQYGNDSLGLWAATQLEDAE